MFFVKKKPSKIIFSEVAEQIEAKLYTYDCLSMKNKSHTYDVIGHMVWQPYWIYPKTDKKSSPERLDKSRGNFTQVFPKPWVYKWHIAQLYSSRGMSVVVFMTS